MVGGCETEGAVVSFREAEEATGSGGGGGGGGDDEAEGAGRSSEDKIGGGGNRWPQQETMALLAIRSELDLVFRKATLKAPLWEEVSRKLGEVGFNRTPKKCKEKFENVYKYHRRTKDGRCRRQAGKAYKFFQQLEALDAPPLPLPHPHPHPHTTHPNPLSPPAADHMVANPMIHPIAAYRVRNNAAQGGGGHRRRHHQDTTTVTSRSRSTEDTHDDADFAFTPASLSTDDEDTTLSSSLSGGEKDPAGRGSRRRKRKRKLEALFNRLMKEVVEKQEDLQRQFMDAIDKCETQRRAREEVWKAQELAKLKREQDILAQERAISAAKDAAVMAFLHKMSSSSSHNSFPSELLEPQPQPPPPPEERAGQKPSAEMTPTTTMAAAAATPTSQNNNNNIIIIDKKENAGGSNSLMFTSSTATTNNQIQIQTSPLIMSASAPNSSPRWPKAEVDALIRIRTDMEQRYLENGPKGLLWEEISLKMKKLGYHRSSKKCKEKWENINKYFRRVKDTKRKRGEDAKTCPYFHQLDALYREKGAAVAATATATCNNNNNTTTAITVATTSSSSTSTTPLHPASYNRGPHLKPEELLMQMMAQDRPQQMVRPAPAPAPAQEQNANNDDIEGEMSGGEDDEVAEDDDADFDEAQEEEEDGDAYQIVANNNSSSMPVMRC